MLRSVQTHSTVLQKKIKYNVVEIFGNSGKAECQTIDIFLLKVNYLSSLQLPSISSQLFHLIFSTSIFVFIIYGETSLPESRWQYASL